MKERRRRRRCSFFYYFAERRPIELLAVSLRLVSPSACLFLRPPPPFSNTLCESIQT